MDKSDAISALAALANDTRLDVFRLLLRQAPDGLAAGEIADRLGAVQNTMSNQLAILTRTGLITGRREGRNVYYTASPVAMRELLGWLMQDCCQGNADICEPLLDAITCRTC